MAQDGKWAELQGEKTDSHLSDKTNILQMLTNTIHMQLLQRFFLCAIIATKEVF